MENARPETAKAQAIKQDGDHVEEAQSMEVDAEGLPISFAGMTLENVLLDLGKPSYKVPHLRKLNFVLLAALLTTATNGFDGSMMNGLQTLPLWQESKQYTTSTP